MLTGERVDASDREWQSMNSELKRMQLSYVDGASMSTSVIMRCRGRERGRGKGEGALVISFFLFRIVASGVGKLVFTSFSLIFFFFSCSWIVCVEEADGKQGRNYQN